MQGRHVCAPPLVCMWGRQVAAAVGGGEALQARLAPRRVSAAEGVNPPAYNVLNL